MAEGEKGVGTAGPQHGSKVAPKGMRVVRRTSGRRVKKREERLDDGVDMKARKGDTSCVPRMTVLEKLSSAKRERKKIRGNHYSLMVSFQLTQMKLERVKRGLKVRNVLAESLREATKAKNRGEGGQERGPREVKKRRQSENCMQERLYGFARALYARV